MSTTRIVFGRPDFNLEEKYFFLNGEQYEYFLAYGKGGLNERIIELPLVCKYINAAIGKNILEVGATISLLIKTNFDVVDLTEEDSKIINVDILDYCPSKRYDLIFSISTIEHFGHGDYGDIKLDGKILPSLQHMISLLNNAGVLVVTAPIGWNSELDVMIAGKSLPFQEIYFMKRYSSGKWRQVELNEAMNTKYGFPWPYANAIFLGEYINNGT